MSLVALSAFAEERTVTLSNAHTPREVQEMMTIARTVLDVRDIGIDGNTVRLDGPPEQNAATEWLLSRLDKPEGWKPAEQERANPASRTHGAMRVYYLADNSQPQAVQERLTILRTVLDTQKIFNYTRHSALVARGTGPELEAIEWLLNALDHPDAPQTYKVDIPRLDTVRVLRLDPSATLAQTQDSLKQARMKTLKAFNLTSPPLIVARASAADIAALESVIR